MDSVWLEDFLAVVEEGGFSRAAERRAVSQPAFSRRIRALEDWIGASLFDRSTHSVRLTPAGESFLPAAEDLIRRLRFARADAVSAAQAASETLRFAATHVLSLTFFPFWFRDVEAGAPMTATVQLTADHMQACEKLMLTGKVQFLLCHEHPAAASLPEESFRSVLVGQDELLPVVAPPFQAGAPLQTLPYLGYSPESGMGRILAAVGRVPAAQPVFASHLAGVLAAMARDGRGMAWSPASLIAGDLAVGRLLRAGSAADVVPMEIRLFRPRARQTPAAEALWERVVRRG